MVSLIGLVGLKVKLSKQKHEQSVLKMFNVLHKRKTKNKKTKRAKLCKYVSVHSYVYIYKTFLMLQKQQ